MKLFFTLVSITFSSALSMDHKVEDTEKTIHEYFVDSEWLDHDAGKLSIYFKVCIDQTTIQTDSVIQIAGSKQQFLPVLPSLKQLRNRTPAIPFAFVRTFRWIRGGLMAIIKNDFSLFPNVEEIDLHSNDIKYINPEAFRRLKKLKKVWLDNNRLSQGMIACLKQNLAHLEILDCHGQRTPAEKDPNSSQARRGLLTKVASHVTMKLDTAHDY